MFLKVFYLFGIVGHCFILISQKHIFTFQTYFPEFKIWELFQRQAFFGQLRLICWRCFFRHLVFSLYMDIYGLIWTWFCRSILYLHAFSCADRWSPLPDCWRIQWVWITFTPGIWEFEVQRKDWQIFYFGSDYLLGSMHLNVS